VIQSTHALTPSRPRVEGAREQEIFGATLELLAEAGYDRLTLDAVAARAKASKATLYRRWAGKADLVCDAMGRLHLPPPQLPDTGSLRGDLLVLADKKGFLDPTRGDVLCGLATAMYRDADLAHLLRERLLTPGQDVLRQLFERAKVRGQLRDGADPALLCEIIPALILHHLTFVEPGAKPHDFIVRILDEVLLPAAIGVAPGSTGT
jgi:AcrR family transcriptional regulator